MAIEILVFGGAHIDRRGRIFGDLVPGASNPGRWLEEPGGGAFNAARALSRLGHAVTLISPRGGDAAALRVALAAEAAGIDDRPFTFLDRCTPSYTAILERDGNLAIGLADMDLYRQFTPRRLRVRAVRDALAEATMILVDANLPEETLAAIASEARMQDKPVAGIGISPAKVLRFRACLGDLDCLFLNVAEASVLAGQAACEVGAWPGLLRARGLRAAVVTDGGRPVLAYDDAGAWLLQPPPLSHLADVTGAGDSLAAGFVSACRQGKAIADALRSGVALAGMTLGSHGATLEELTPAHLAAALSQVGLATRLETGTDRVASSD